MSLGRGLSLEAREEEVPALANEVEDTPPLENVGPSWLWPEFVMPTEEEALRSLAVEIQEVAPPLCNVQFTNRYAASYIGRAILDQATDIESLKAMGEMGLEEATNRAEALISRVSFLLRRFGCFTLSIF